MSKTSRQEDPPSPLLRKLNKLIRELAKEATAPRVHHVRTTLRRIETRMMASGGKQELPKLLKKLRRRAGKLRDVDVQLVALRGIRLESARQEKARLTRTLCKIRAKNESKLTSLLEEISEKNPGGQLQAFLTVPASAAAAEKARTSVKAARQMFAAALERYSPLSEGNLHAFRMECKRARYVAEMAAELASFNPMVSQSMISQPTISQSIVSQNGKSTHGHGEQSEAQLLVEQFKRIQDAVGEWHDWQSLTEQAGRVLAPSSGGLLPALRAMKRSKFLEAMRVIPEVKDSVLGGVGFLRKASKSEEIAPVPARAS
ncbi:MAG TPA: CHAD domain-containing protein [Terriglobales bacterium]|nr:CHAD domain-containing protein [Terriglobales bacterium]